VGQHGGHQPQLRAVRRYVAPRFQGQLDAIYDSRDWVEENMRHVFGGTNTAMAKAFTDAGKPVPEPIAKAEAERLARKAAKESESAESS